MFNDVLLTMILTACSASTEISSSSLSKSLQCNHSAVISTELAKSGCCSWHQGVCGCKNGRQLCCDGTMSPTCMCGEYIESNMGFHN